jgi:hypothetical protein
VDDSLLVYKANLVEWRRLTKLLEDYEVTSRQKLNKEKTSIFFSRNTSAAKKEEIIRLSELNATQCFEKYLGAPTILGREKYKAFQSIKDRVWTWLNDWKVKFLSQAGKEILIKAVAQANTAKIHWMSWEKMGTSKNQGRLGFRDLVTFNKALLAKQFWRILQNPDSLVTAIMKAKYFPYGTMLDANLGSRPSMAWRSILSSKDIIRSG